MKKNGEVVIDTKSIIWDVTFYNNEITLFSNGFYLDIKEDKENVIGSKIMKEWYFKEIDENYYYFKNKEKENNNNILYVEEDEIKVNQEIEGENGKFQLIEFSEENKNINSQSNLSNSIYYEFSSKSLSN